MLFKDRQDAGQQLAKALSKFQGEDIVVLALPRGGVVPAGAVAAELNTPLGVILVRKIGHPFDAEYALGAVVENQPAVYKGPIGGIDPKWLHQAEKAAQDLNEQRRVTYFGKDFPQPEINGKTVILVDDGIATGTTMEAAAKAVLGRHPKKLIVAVPVAPKDSIEILKSLANEVIVLDNPENFMGSVGAHYQNFPQIEDEEVKGILYKANNKIAEAI